MKSRNSTYLSPTNEQMDVTFFNYFSTVALGLMCYSFFNPGFVFDMSLFLAYGFARTMITGCDIYNQYIYTPYRKHIKKPLMEILNIDNGLYEVEIVKNGRIIHKFKTMSDFIKCRPIKFINEDSEDSGSESGSESGTEKNESEQQQRPLQRSESQSQTHIDSDIKVEIHVDADLTHENVDIHKVEPDAEQSVNKGEGEDNDSEEVDTEDTNDTDTDTDDSGDDNLILDPSEYDFVLRNIYFEDDTVNTPFGYCLKYETFRKSDMKPEQYEYEEIKNMVSKRRFIGIHLKTEEKDYVINLSSPVNYYLVNNTILDYSFLKMYIFNRYNVSLGNTYKLSCIDNFIEMYNIEQGKKFFVKNNMFKVVDDETYKVDDESVSTEASEREDTVKPTQDTSDALTEADIEIVESNYNYNYNTQ
jgi:hypothetical protein